MSLDKTSLTQVPQNGIFEYYLHRAQSSKSLRGPGHKNTAVRGIIPEEKDEEHVSPQVRQMQLKAADPQFQFWRMAAREIQKHRPTSRGQKSKPWRDNSKPVSTVHQKASLLSPVAPQAMQGEHVQAIQNQVSELQYAAYLGKVNILNQKKEFLKQFRASLQTRQKYKLVAQIRQLSSEIGQIEAHLFKPQ